MGGEKHIFLGSYFGVKGSPPRGRGKGPWKGEMHRMDKDHPRVGGEKRQRRRNGNPILGSPPRGRGKEIR